MNIIQAIRSGKSFKRPDWRGWVTAKNSFLTFADNKVQLRLTVDDLLAYDYYTNPEGG